jgi:hypothetical protein
MGKRRNLQEGVLGMERVREALRLFELGFSILALRGFEWVNLGAFS